jgi:hypothetical protein
MAADQRPAVGDRRSIQHYFGTRPLEPSELPIDPAHSPFILQEWDGRQWRTIRQTVSPSERDAFIGGSTSGRSAADDQGWPRHDGEHRGIDEQ